MHQTCICYIIESQAQYLQVPKSCRSIVNVNSIIIPFILCIYHDTQWIRPTDWNQPSFTYLKIYHTHHQIYCICWDSSMTRQQELHIDITSLNHYIEKKCAAYWMEHWMLFHTHPIHLHPQRKGHKKDRAYTSIKVMSQCNQLFGSFISFTSYI